MPEKTKKEFNKMPNKILAIDGLKVYEGEGGHTYISGYANTKNIADRYGDIPTVYAPLRNFVYDISAFKNNPVMLINHNNAVEFIAGSFVEIREDDKGLFITGKFSKSDLPIVKHAREVYAEGHAKALSISGRWHFEDTKNPKHLTLAEIYEISLVAVPADPNALATAFEKALNILGSERKSAIESIADIRSAEKFLKADIGLSANEAKTLISKIKGAACDEPSVVPAVDGADIEKTKAAELDLIKAGEILSALLTELKK
jgi:HK97 family phage prohead protease